MKLSYQLSDFSLKLCFIFAILTAIVAPISTAATTVGLIAVPVFWILSGTALTTLSRSWAHPLGKAVVFFVVWLLVSTSYADTDWSSKLKTFVSWKKLIYVFVLLGISQQLLWKQRFINAYVLAMSVAGLISLICLYVDVGREGNVSGIIMTNNDTQAIAFVVSVICSLFLLNQSIQHKLYKYILISNIALSLLNVFYVCGSRSCLIALPLVLVFVFFKFYGAKKLPHILLGTAVLVSVLGLTSTTLQQRVTQAFAEQAHYMDAPELTSVGIRMVFYTNTIALIKESPLLGYGTSSFEKVYTAYASTHNLGWQATPTGDPHNQYLFVWLENGVIGLLLFLFYIHVAFKEYDQNQPYTSIACCVLLTVCITSLFNSHFKTHSEGYLLAFFMGMLLARPMSTDLPISNA